MPANGPLYLAAGLVTVIGLAHSCLGERFVIGRLLALPDLPRLGGDVGYMRRIVRYAWHLTSIAWWGMAAVLLTLAMHPINLAFAVALIFAATLLVSGAIVLAASRRHPAWPLFFLAAAATLVATW